MRARTLAALIIAALMALVPPALAQTRAGADLSGPPPELSEGVFSWRTFTAKPGSFEEMLRLSQQIIWPFYEKLGARNVAFWRELPGSGAASADTETIHMITHYVSVEHWEMTRAPWAAGEDDAAFLRMANAMIARQRFVIAQEQRMLSGYLSSSPPQRLDRSSDWPLHDSAAYPKICAQALEGLRLGWTAAGADSYCSCVHTRLGADPSGWGRPHHLVWLRSGEPTRPEATIPEVGALHAACAPL